MPLILGKDGVNREIKDVYLGVGGINKQVKELYLGKGGVNKQVYTGELFRLNSFERLNPPRHPESYDYPPYTDFPQIYAPRSIELTLNIGAVNDDTVRVSNRGCRVAIAIDSAKTRFIIFQAGFNHYSVRDPEEGMIQVDSSLVSIYYSSAPYHHTDENLGIFSWDNHKGVIGTHNLKFEINGNKYSTYYNGTLLKTAVPQYFALPCQVYAYAPYMYQVYDYEVSMLPTNLVIK